MTITSASEATRGGPLKVGAGDAPLKVGAGDASESSVIACASLGVLETSADL